MRPLPTYLEGEGINGTIIDKMPIKNNKLHFTLRDSLCYGKDVSKQMPQMITHLYQAEVIMANHKLVPQRAVLSLVDFRIKHFITQLPVGILNVLLS